MKKSELIDILFLGLIFTFACLLTGIIYFSKSEKFNIIKVVKPVYVEVVTDKRDRIEITTAGDCTLGADTNFGYSGQFDWWFKNKANGDYGYFFAKVKHLFENDDYSYVNLEGTLTKATKKTTKKFNFKGDPSYTNILISGGIEGVNIANNHSNDYGTIGYNDTQKYLQEAGIDYFGHDHVLIKEIKGKKIAFVGYTSVGLWVDKTKDISETIKRLRESGTVDLIIANFHFGIEYSHSASTNQRNWAHLAIDSGADIVIGSHPHCLQGMELYKGKYIVYSLGNFVFGGNSAPKQIGRECLIVKLYFDYLNDELEGIKVKLIPCEISSISSRNNYQPVPVTGSKKDNYLKTVNRYSYNYKYVDWDWEEE